MRHVFYRPIYGTVPRAYYGMFCVCFLRISRELWVGVNRSVVVKLSNQVNTSWVNKEAWYSLFHVFVKGKYEKVLLAWPGPLIILGFALSKNPHFTSTCFSYFQVTTSPYLFKYLMEGVSDRFSKTYPCQRTNNSFLCEYRGFNAVTHLIKVSNLWYTDL